ELSIGEEDPSIIVTAKVPAKNMRIISTPKFKRHRVSAIWHFLPGCGRVTASNFGLT
ncbi:hypothetical protein J1N35_001043, partial [Gossypium stocksii]